MWELYKLSYTEEPPDTEWTLYSEAATVVYVSSPFSLSLHRQRPDLNSAAINNSSKTEKGGPMLSNASGVV